MALLHGCRSLLQRYRASGRDIEGSVDTHVTELSLRRYCWGIWMSKKPCSSAKEPYISAKELHISAKEPCIFAKKPFVFAKEPSLYTPTSAGAFAPAPARYSMGVKRAPHLAKETCIPAKETHTLRHAQTEPLQKRHTPTAAGALLRGIRYYACQKSPISLPKSPVSFQKRRDAYGCL